MLSRERFEPCLLGGLLPVLLGGRLLLRLPGRLPPGVSDDLTGADPFLAGGLENDPSLSLRESDVAEKDERPRDPALPIGTLRALRSRTFVIGPALDSDCDR